MVFCYVKGYGQWASFITGIISAVGVLSRKYSDHDVYRVSDVDAYGSDADTDVKQYPGALNHVG